LCSKLEEKDAALLISIWMERQTLMAKNPPAKAAKPSNTHNETYTKTGKPSRKQDEKAS